MSYEVYVYTEALNTCMPHGIAASKRSIGNDTLVCIHFCSCVVALMLALSSLASIAPAT